MIPRPNVYIVRYGQLNPPNEKRSQLFSLPITSLIIYLLMKATQQTRKVFNYRGSQYIIYNNLQIIIH